MENGNGPVIAIGNILKDRWFYIREFFADDDGHAVYVLDERKKNKDN